MTRALKIQLLIWGTVFIFMVGMMLHIQQLILISMILALIGPTSYLLSYHRLRGLHVRRTLPPRMTAGEASEVTLTLSNPGARTRPVFWVEDQLPPGLTSESDGSLLVLDLAPHEEREVNYELQARRRGLFHLGPVRLRASDTLALHDFEETLPAPDELLVYPRAIPLISLWPRSPADRASPRRSRRRPGGIDPRGTREYVPGDDLRHIHWKLSARRNRLMLVEREQAEGLRATLLLDLSRGLHVGQGNESTLEYGVSLAASLLVQALEEGGSAALVAHGDRDYSVPSESTPRHRWKLLEALARVQEGDPVPLAERAVAMVRRLPRGSAVTVITPQIGPGMISLANLMGSHGLRVVWFLLVAPTFEAGRPTPLSEDRYRQQAGDLARRGQTAYLVGAGTNVEASLGRWMREAG